MKAKEFITVLRTLIREEVRSAVRQELKQALSENKLITSNQTSSKQKPIKKYTGNPMLDEVLNETKLTSDFRQSPDVSEWPEMSYTTDNMPSLQSQASMMDVDINEDYEAPLPQTNQGLPFMKDYTKLMKRADEIAQQKQF